MYFPSHTGFCTKTQRISLSKHKAWETSASPFPNKQVHVICYYSIIILAAHINCFCLEAKHYSDIAFQKGKDSHLVDSRLVLTYVTSTGREQDSENQLFKSQKELHPPSHTHHLPHSTPPHKFWSLKSHQYFCYFT